MTANQFLVVVIMVAVIGMLWKWFPEFRSIVIWCIFGRVDLQLQELPRILVDLAENEYEVLDESTDRLTKLTFQHGNARVGYQGRPGTIERIWATFPRRWGILLTLKDGAVVAIERPWGRTFHAPSLSKEEERSLQLLLGVLKDMSDPEFDT